MLGIMVLTCGLAGWLLYGIAEQQDRQAAEQSVRAVSRSLKAREEIIVKTLKDYAAWGAAYQHLHAAFDFDWAYNQENVGATLFKSYGYDDIFLIDPTDGRRSTPSSTAGAARDALDELIPAAMASSKPPAGPTQRTSVEFGSVTVGKARPPGGRGLSTGGDPTVPVRPARPRSSCSSTGSRPTSSRDGVDAASPSSNSASRARRQRKAPALPVGLARPRRGWLQWRPETPATPCSAR